MLKEASPGIFLSRQERYRTTISYDQTPSAQDLFQ
jgi:hypothetical protein